MRGVHRWTLLLLLVLSGFPGSTGLFAGDGRCSFLPESEKARRQLQSGRVLISVQHLKNGNYHIQADILIPCSRRTLWQVLTEYNQLADFIPRMKASRVLIDSGRVKHIQQTGTSRFLLFSKTVRVILRVQEQPADSIRFSLIAGDFRTFRGGWYLSGCPDDSVSLLCYRAVLRPAFFAPAFVTKSVQKHDVPRMLKAIRTRCQAREGRP